MLNQPLILSNAVYAPAFVVGIETEHDGMRLRFADGTTRLYPLKDIGQHKGADGRAILEAFARFQFQRQLEHYKAQNALFDKLEADGQISENDEFRRPTMPVEHPEQLF